MLKMVWYLDKNNRLSLRWEREDLALAAECDAQVRAFLECPEPAREVSRGSASPSTRAIPVFPRGVKQRAFALMSQRFHLTHHGPGRQAMS